MKITEQQNTQIAHLLGWSEYLTQPLMQHGSDRSYFRLTNRHDNSTVIHMIYETEKAENEYYHHIQEFLNNLGFSVPEIVFYLPEAKWIFLQDLGNTTLYALKDTIHTAEHKKLYCSILDQVTLLYSKGYEHYKKNPFKTAGQFDYQLYQWEQKYFTDNYLIRYRNMEGIVPELQMDFDIVASMLANCPNRIVHRDLQSKNIMIHDRKPYFIDFQGLRPGLPEYDLASLIYDPYMNLDDDLREELIRYCEHTMIFQWRRSSTEIFRKIFIFCSIQRILQVLGAYCFLGLQKNKREFLQYIPVAETILLKQLEKINILHPLIKLLSC